MKSFSYRSLADLTRDELDQFISEAKEFKVVVTGKAGQHIDIFLKNEDEYAAAPKPKALTARFRYLRGAVHMLFALGFMPLWSTARINGFRVESTSLDGYNYEFLFVR